MPDVRTAVARRDEQKAQRQQAAARYIERLGPQIARALPAHLTGDRMTRLALTAVRKTPELAECSEVSMAGALLTAAALGLEPNTPTAEAYLVPYAGEVTLIVGYQGFVKLFWQHPLAAALRAEAVYACDDFDYAYGSGAFLRHKPNKRVPVEERGEPTDYYAWAKLTTGAEAFVVLSPDEVKALRQGKVGPDPRFKGGDPQRWMERKTCIRQLFKLLPKTPNMALASRADEQGGSELYRAAAAERVSPPPAIEGALETADGQPVVQSAEQGAEAEAGEPEVQQEQPPPRSRAAAKATQAQMDKIHAHLSDLGVESDAAVHQALSEILARPIASRKELTRDDASTVIERLTAMGEPPAPESGEQR